MRARWVEIAAATLLAVFLALVWTAAARKSETIDEPLFIGLGVAQVELANPNLDLSHPPLLRWLAGWSARYPGGARYLPAAVPIVPRGAMDLYAYKVQDAFDWSAAVLYEKGNDHVRALFWGRVPFALFAVLTALLLLMEVRLRFGAVPALAALAIFCFTPEVLAHAQWAHSDLASAAALLLTALLLARALESPAPRNDVYLGLALGVSICLKLTGLLLLPVLLPVVALWNRPEAGSRLKFVALRLARIVATLWCVIVIAYLPAPRLFNHAFLPSDLAHLVGGSADGLWVTSVAAFLRWLPLPDTFLKGVIYTALNGQHGQLAFFHGEVRSEGWWYYFPMAMILKYPTPLLLLAGGGLVAALRLSRLSAPRKLAWILPPLVIFGFAMAQRVDIGVRSILPIAPFLALWSAAALAAARARLPRFAVVGAMALSIFSGVTAWPNFLTWFNPLFGGTAAADKWLSDSNIDWGQDLPELARVIKARGNPEVHLAFWGYARPVLQGIRAVDPRERAAGYYAISRYYFSGIFGHQFDWLRALPVEEYAGGSIALIYVRAEDLARGVALPQEKAPTADTFLDRSLHEYAEGRFVESIASARKALELRPTYAEAWNNIGAAYNKLGEFEKGAAACEEALRLKPDFPLAKNNLEYARRMMKTGEK